jgi:hypothetical protein
MIQYIENFASGFLQKDIQKEILSSTTWLWQYRSETAGQYPAPDFAWVEDENTEDTPQLIHIVDERSRDMQFVSPLVYNIIDTVGYEVQFQRIKANLLWANSGRKNPNSYHRPHADHGRPDALSLIYYVNDSDGDTVIFKNRWVGQDPGKLEVDQRITPKAGSALLFDSTLYHASSSPTNGVRSVLNFIFWPKQVDPADPDGLAPEIPINIPVGRGFNRE